MPDATMPGGGMPLTEFDVRIADQKKLLDELMRRYTDQHPDVVSTKRLIAQLEEEKKQQLDTRRKAAAANPNKFTPSTNPVFQKIKISLSDAEANIAALRARLVESEGRLAQLKAVAGRAPQVEAEMAQLNRDYGVLRKNYEQLVARRESASMAEDVDSLASMAEFRIIDPPRISPKAVFPEPACAGAAGACVRVGGRHGSQPGGVADPADLPRPAAAAVGKQAAGARNHITAVHAAHHSPAATGELSVR